MSEVITVRGFVATEVREDTTQNGHPMATFRLGATERRFNRDTNEWSDGDTSWYSVVCFRNLAKNVAFSVQKGERVIISGRLKIRNWSMPDGRSGTTADIEADTVGHDLVLGVTKYKRSSAAAAEATAPHVEGLNGETEQYTGLNPETGELPDDSEEDGSILGTDDAFVLDADGTGQQDLEEAESEERKDAA